MFEPVLALGWPLLTLLAVSAVVIGFAKTSFGGVASIAVASFALAMPAKESTATVLLLLIVGDMVAIARYRTVSWRLLWKLIPGVLPGLILGAVFMSFVDDITMRRTIGGLLLLMVVMQAWQRRRASAPVAPDGPHPIKAAGTGVAAGFTTMTANAAGPVMALYLLAAGIDKARFIGTNAWFFAIVNLTKVPLAASIGLFTPTGLLLDLTLVPLVLIGTVIGAWVIKHVSQRQFETVTLVASAVGAVVLLVR